MHHRPIALPDSAASSRTGDRSGHILTELAAGLDARFVQAGTTLSVAVETIDRVVSALDEVTGALDASSAASAIHDLTAIAEQLRGLPEKQAARAADLAAIDATSKALRAGALTMHENLHILQIYGTNIKIAAAAEPAFVGFVDGMATKLEVGKQLLDALLLQLKELVREVAIGSQSGRLLARECALVVPHVPAQLAKDAAALDAYLQSLASVAKRVSEIARGVQGQVAIALGTLQVGDSTRQRLEHVVAGLQMLESACDASDEADGLDPAVGTIVVALLAAQLDATAATFDEEAERLVASLRGLGPKAEQLLALIEQEEDGKGRAFLAQLEHGIGEVARVTSQLGDAEGRARQMTAVVAMTVEALTGRLQHIGGVRRDVQDIATNTRLLCRRHGNTGKAVSVIAIEIDVQAASLGQAMDGVRKPIETLAAVRAAMQDAQWQGSIDIDATLSGALKIVREGCLRTERALGAGDDDARQLIALLDRSVDELSAQLALGGHIRTAASALRMTVAEALDPTANGTIVLHDLLARIAALYTMASERVVHADAVPAAFAPPPAAVVEADDDDDDGLF